MPHRFQRKKRSKAQPLIAEASFSPIGVAHIDLKTGCVLEANADLCKLLGTKRSDLVGKPFTVQTGHDEGLTDIESDSQASVDSSPASHRGKWDNKNIKPHVNLKITPLVFGKRTPHPFGIYIVQDVGRRHHDPREESRLPAILESSDDAIVAKAIDGTILDWNPAAERLFGYSAADAVGQPITLIVPPEREKEERQILNQIKKGHPIDHYETTRIAKGGRLLSVSLSILPLRNAEGRVVAASTIIRDRTEKQRAEVALRDREQRLQAIVNTAADAIITIDERGIIESANPTAEFLFGFSQMELVGTNVNRLMPEPFRREHDGYINNYIRTGKRKIIGIGREVTGRRKDATTFPMNLSVSEVKLSGRRLFTGIVHDLSGRRQLERQILETASNEQRRIGQDLHDGLCQDLIGIALGIDAAARSLPAEAAATKSSLQALAASVRTSAGQARDFAHGLNPVDLKSGLWSALDSLAKKVSQTYGVNCVLRWDRVAQVRDDTMATHLYRIAQEAVSNAVRHGKAKEIEISLAVRGGTLLLAIADNGIGIAREFMEGVKQGLSVTRAKPQSHAPTGIGLQTMHYRARVIGGTFTLEARKGGGTVVTCVIRQEPTLESWGGRSVTASKDLRPPTSEKTPRSREGKSL